MFLERPLFRSVDNNISLATMRAWVFVCVSYAVNNACVVLNVCSINKINHSDVLKKRSCIRVGGWDAFAKHRVGVSNTHPFVPGLESHFPPFSRRSNRINLEICTNPLTSRCTHARAHTHTHTLNTPTHTPIIISFLMFINDK